MKNKRIISFLMTVALVFAMVPALGDTARATGPEENSVYFGVDNTGANPVKLESVHKYTRASTASFVYIGQNDRVLNDYMEWNSTTGTLTLHNFLYTEGTNSYNDGTHKAVLWTNVPNLTIVLEGTNEIACTETGTTNAAIYSTGNVTITGAGILTVTGADPGAGNSSAGIWCDGNGGLNINAKVNATGGNGDTGNGSSSYGVYIPNGGLEVGEKGTLTAKGGTADTSCSINANAISDYVAALGGTNEEDATLLDLENDQTDLTDYPYAKAVHLGKVSFHPNFLVETDMPAQPVPLNIPTKLNANIYTRGGYNFAGWNTAEDGSGEAYADKADITLTDSALTLYAQWTKKKSKSRKRNANVVGVAADPTPQDTPQVSTAQEEAQIEKVTQAEPVPPGVKLGAGDVRLSPQRVTVNGVENSVEAYNIFGTNFFKLRDLAAMLSGTPAQFNVEYDAARNAIIITKGAAYGGSVETNFTDRSESAMTSPQTVFIDGVPTPLTAYNIGGNNFFSLRDLAPFLGYSVSYDEASNTAVIESM